jgi:hypothetical protein
MAVGPLFTVTTKTAPRNLDVMVPQLVRAVESSIQKAMDKSVVPHELVNPELFRQRFPLAIN